MKITVGDLLEMTGMEEAKAKSVEALLMQSYDIKGENQDVELISAIAQDTPAGVWKASGKEITVDQADKLIDRCRKEAPVQINVEVDLTEEKKKNTSESSLTTFNNELGQRRTGRTNLRKLAKAIWAALIESSGLRQWVIQNFERDALGEMVDPTLGPLVTTWFRQVGSKDASGWVKDIEVLGTSVRYDAMAAIINMFSGTTFDFVLSAIADIQRGKNKGEKMAILGINSVDTRDYPDDQELLHEFKGLLEELNNLYASGLHVHNTTSLVQEYEQIIYPALSDPGFAAGIKGIRVPYGQSPVEALKKYMPQKIRSGLVIAEKIRNALEALIAFDEETQSPIEEFIKIGPAAQEYRLAGKDHARQLEVTPSNAFIGVVGLSAKLTVKIGETQVTLSVGSSSSAPAVFVYQNDPTRFPRFSPNEPSHLVNYLFKVWFGGKGDLVEARQIMISYLPEDAVDQIMNGLAQSYTVDGSAALWVKKLTDFRLPAKFHPQLGGKGRHVRAIAVVLLQMIKDMPGELERIERLAFHYANLGEDF